MDQEFRHWAEERDREFREWSEKRDREHRDLLNALLERHVSITQQMIDAMTAGFAQLQAEIADQRAQIQVNTQAVLRLLDRLGPA